MVRALTPAIPAARAAADALGVSDFRTIEATAAWVESGRVLPAAARLLGLWRAANPEVDRLGDPALDPDPGRDALAAWCVMAAAPPEVDDPTDRSRMGWMVGVVRDRYLYRSEAGGSAAAIGFVERLAAVLSACDDPAVQARALERIGAPDPARGQVDAAIAQLGAVARRAVPAPTGFEDELGRAAWLLEGALPPTGAAIAAARCELGAAIATAPRDVLAWIGDDPLAIAKAVAREADGADGWLDLLDGTRRAVARHARELIDVTWQAAVASARAAALRGEPTEEGAALAAAGEARAARACERIAGAVAACRAGTLAVDTLVELALAQLEEAG